MLGRVETDQPQCILEIGEAVAGGGVGVAETLAAPFGDRMQGRVLQKLRRRPFYKRVGRLAEPCAKLVDEPRFADAGLADDLHELALAGARAVPAPHEEVELFRATDERRLTLCARLRRPPPLARTMR